ncbi:MAG: SsrA-binding protein [Rickettsiales bacterium]|nr:SsrA-binding protein [Rickettsiales bacterium]
MSKKKIKTFQNRKARFNYETIQKLEAGIVLFGNEIRSIRDGKVVLDNSYAIVKKGEVWILNLYVDLKGYKKTFDNSDNIRPKKLLLKKKQIEKISHSLRSNNYTLIPLDLHFNSKGFLKVDLSISKGRKKADLREYKKQQDWKKEKHKL